MKPLTQHVPARHANTTAPLNHDAARQVVYEMNLMIDEAITTRDTLVRLYGLDVELDLQRELERGLPKLPPGLPPLADLDTDPVAQSAPTPAPAEPKRKAPQPEHPEFAALLEKFYKRGETQEELCRTLLTLPRTFATEKLAQALGVEMKIAYQTTDRLKNRGILERVGMGLWHRIVPAE